MARQQEGAAATASVGERAFALLRSLMLYGLVVAVPVVAYYFGVIDRQARARSELALHALKRVQGEIDTRLERLDVLLKAPSQQDGPAPAARFAELGVELLDPDDCRAPEATATPARPAKDTRVTEVRRLIRRDGQALVCARRGDTALAIPAEQLLDAPAALRRFERVVLADADGVVLASAIAPVAGDPERVGHKPVPATLPPVSIRPWLLQANRDRIAALAGQAKSVPTPEKDREAALGEPAELAATIAGERYRIYLMPFAPERDLQREGEALPVLYVIGIARQSALAEATSALGVEGLWYLLAALLLLLAAGPLLRVLLLSEREAVSRPALALTAVSVVFVPALVTLLMMATLARSDLIARWDARASGYADSIGSEVRAQIDALLDSIDLIGPRFVDPAARSAGLQLLQCRGFELAAGGGETCGFGVENRSYCHVAVTAGSDGDPLNGRIDNLFMTDADGAISRHPFLTTGGCQPRANEIPLASREYFRALSRGNAWPVPDGRGDGLVRDGGGYIAQRIYSRADGTRTLVVAVPRRDRADPGNPFRGIFGAVSTSRPLSAAVTPPLLAFAVIDALSGTVVFHSDDDSSLHENFFEEVDGDDDLIAALRGGAAVQVAGHYQGRSHRFAVRPLDGLPWVVVSWYATADAVTPAATAGLLAVVEMLALILMLAVIGALLVLVLVPLSRAIGWRTEVWQWLWPQWRLRARYRGLALLFVPVIASQALFWMVFDDATMLLQIALGTLVLSISALILLSPARTAHDLPEGAKPPQPGIRARWHHDVTPPQHPIDTLRELHRGYLSALTLAVIALAVVPAIGLYLNALPIVEEALLRQSLAATGAAIERRIATVNGDLRRTALPGMAARAHYPDAATLAARVGSPGAPWTLLRDVPPETCVEVAKRHPSLVLRLVWAGLSGLLPGQSSTFRALDRADRFCRLPGNHGLAYTHPLRFGAAARIVDPEPLPPPGRLWQLAAAGAGPVGGTGTLLATLVALLGLLALLRIVARRVLGIDTPVMPAAPSLGVDHDAALGKTFDALEPAGSEWWYVKIGDDGRVPSLDALKAALQSAADQKPATSVALRNLALAVPDSPSSADAAANNDANAKAEATKPPPRTAQVMTRLSRAALTPSLRIAALDAIETALASGPPVLVLTAITPPWALLCNPESFPDEDPRPDAAEALRWRAVRARFAVHHVDRDTQTATLGSESPVRDPALKRELEDERIALQELIGRPYPPLDAVLRSVRLRALEDFVQLALPLVEPQFRREWQHCTQDERVALFELAHDRLLNPLNRSVLDDLLLRRLVVLAPEPRIVCAAFRTFVLRAEPAERMARWRRHGTMTPWQRVRAPFYVTLLLLVAWFAYSFRDAFSTLDAVLAGTLGLFATLGKASSLVRGAQGGDGR